jgi:glutamate dehydrogenase
VHHYCYNTHIHSLHKQDGDVAGNMVRILRREYGTAACVVAMADGSGCAEDSAGLDQTELMRLVDAALPISAFNPALLSPGVYVCT